MAGDPIRQVNAALASIAAAVEASAASTHLHLVQFESTAEHSMYANIKGLRLSGGGGTSFRAAFDATRRVLSKLVKLQPSDCIRICFMTDGMDTAGGLEASAATLKEALAACAAASSAVDVIAFGTFSNFAFLDSLRKLGKVEGSYLYARSGDGPEVLKDMLQLVFDAAEDASHMELPIRLTAPTLGLHDSLAVARLLADPSISSGPTLPVFC
jgi:hypothetical protein